MDENKQLTISSCISRVPTTGLYIDPVKLLQYLDDHAILLAERIALPGLDAQKTELLRGHRQEVLAFKTQLIKALKND